MPGTIIKNYREYRNFSQQYVADKMGISQNAYSKIENNITQLTVNHIKQLALIFQIPVTDLLKEDFQLVPPSGKIEVDLVDKKQVIEKLDRLKSQINSKSSSSHQGYLVMVSLIKATEDIAIGIF